MTASPIESVIFCEGYHDRAFWSGWLKSLGCRVPGNPGSVSDPWGRLVQGGQFAFLTAKNQFLRIVPCKGKTNIPDAFKIRLLGRNTHPVRQIVLCVDRDDFADGSGGNRSLPPERVLQLATEFDPNWAGHFGRRCPGRSGSTDCFCDAMEFDFTSRSWFANPTNARKTHRRWPILKAHADRGPCVRLGLHRVGRLPPKDPRNTPFLTWPAGTLTTGARPFSPNCGMIKPFVPSSSNN